MEGASTKKRKGGIYFDAAPADIITDYTRGEAKRKNLQDLCNRDTVRPIIPPSNPRLLRELSAKPVDLEPLGQSLFAFVVIRECERLLQLHSSDPPAPAAVIEAEVTTVRDVERLERRADDFLLVNRHESDAGHRARLWVARCKLSSLRTLLLKRTANAQTSADSTNNGAPCDPLRRASREISDEMLASWMAENNIGSSGGILRVDAATRQWKHALGSCGLSALWATIRAFRDKWTHLPISPYLYAMLEKLRDRVAFFMDYREPVVEQVEHQRQQKTVKILGLSRSSWRTLDPEWVRGSKYSAAASAAAQAARVLADSSLINSPELSRTVESQGKLYMCINEDFIEETERVLNSMLIELRKCAGFEWHEQFDETRCDCFACAELASSSTGAVGELDEARKKLDNLITSELSGNFRDFVQTEFRTHIWDAYLQPGEREMFLAYRPLDNNTAQSIISRSRAADGKNISRRLCERNVAQIWAEFTSSNTAAASAVNRECSSCSGGCSACSSATPVDGAPILIDYSQRLDPACSLITRLALGFYMDARSKGGQFLVYVIDCQRSNDPFLYADERMGKVRNLYGEFHTPMQTTGTLCWRYKYQRRVGMRAPEKEIYYEHPLILRTFATFCVLYNGRMHLCSSFAEAFLVWLAVMCEDPKIGAETCTDFSLLELYEKLFPRRATHIALLRRGIEARKSSWDPLSRLFPATELSKRDTTATATTQSESIQY